MQLLETGFFHADPHPGNLIRTTDGRLCILDFGLVTEMNEKQKLGIFQSIIHVIQKDYDKLAIDFDKLGFFPDNRPSLSEYQKSIKSFFGTSLSNGGLRGVNFNEATRRLAKFTYAQPYRLPPYFTLLLRAIAILEGVAMKGDPNFAILKEAYPFIAQKVLIMSQADEQGKKTGFLKSRIKILIFLS